jgi:predicted alpha/beta superfamily hydrolase
MDTKIEEKKCLKNRVIKYIIICLSILIVGYFLIFKKGGSSLNEKKEQVAVSTVKERVDTGGTRDKKSITIGESFNFPSQIMNEERKIQVYLPSGYKQSGDKYHVLYILDGEASFYFASGIVHYLSRACYIPKIIVVAIPNNNRLDRNRNMTPTKLSITPLSGGAGLFFKFIKEELIPYIESNYRTYPFKIFAGHSLGGLFVIHSLLVGPGVFNAYIATSPSLWWDKGLLIENAKIFFSSRVKLDRVLAMTLCQEGELMRSSLEKFEKVIRNRAPEGFRLYVRYMHDEDKDDHITTIIRSTTLALRVIYKNWQLPDDIIKDGLRSMKTHLVKLSGELGYNVIIPEYLANKMGYGYFYEKKYERAINMFKYNAEVYPDSLNVYDSLGEAYMQNGQYELAKINYAKVLEFEPENLHAKKMLRILAKKVKKKIDELDIKNFL